MERVFVENLENTILTTLQRNARKLIDMQTVVETTWCMQNFQKMEKRKRDPVCKNAPET